MTSAPAVPVVLVAGATGELGRVAAASFARDGARLGLGGRDRGRLQALADELALPDDQWVAAVGDLRESGGAQAAVTATTERFGGVDVVLHLAGGWSGGAALVDIEPAAMTAMLDQHVWSTFHLARAVVPVMSARGWGRIVAVTSSFTASPGPRSAAYIAAKSAQEGMLRVLAREVAPAGVTVNVVAVRAIDAAHERETAPAPRNAGWSTPEEIVAAIRFLCSDGAAAVNGVRLSLDGRA